MLSRITFLLLVCSSLFGVEHVYLKTPNLSQEEMIGTNVGVRPYRKSGIRIEAEKIGDKFIIHNYGYGGSGITLSFGGSKETIELLENETAEKTVAVLGAGVIGLATAYDLLEKGYNVHLYANAWSPNLTSNVAAGIWSPLSFPSYLSEDKSKFHQKLLENSEARFLKSTTNEPEFAGVSFIQSYSFKVGDSEGAIKTKNRGEEVIVHFDNGVIKNGRRVTELAIDGKLFMEDLFSKVKSNGAVLEEMNFSSIEDVLSLKEPIIINCLSMGSRELFNDQDFIPSRGQIIYFKFQPGIDYLLYQNVPNNPNTWVSIYPWSDRIILGGVYEHGEERLNINQDIINKIIENALYCLEN